MKCKHKDCIENWPSDDQWAIQSNGCCIRCNAKMSFDEHMTELTERAKSLQEGD